MSMPKRSRHFYEFGSFRLDPEKHRLWRDGDLVHLSPKAVDALIVLVQNAGKLLERETLMQEVWSNTFVEDANLTVAISHLRKALGQNAETAEYIETIPRVGYRFVAEVREVTEQPAPLVVEKQTLSRTVIEEEFIPDEPHEPEMTEAIVARRVVARHGLTVAPLTAVTSLAIVGVLIAMTLGGFAYFRHWKSSGTNAAATNIKSIAVLPVKSFSNNQDDEELRLRITDALITRLGHLDWMAVRPTSAMLPFAKSGQDSLEIGKKLRVDAVIESRLQREGERLRVTVQLVKVSNGEQVWSDQFDGQANEILNLQDLISSKVARSLTSDASKQSLAKRPTKNSDAYEAYLNGRYHWTKRDEADLRQAIDYFKKAITLDQDFSEAYTGLADSQTLLFNYNYDLRPEVIAEAKKNLHRALELKPDSADALTTLGAIQMVYDWDWKAAEESLKAATTAERNLSIAHMRYGSLLARLGRIPEALTESERAVELDPLSIAGITNLGLIYFCKKDFAAADIQFRKALDLGDTVGASHWLFARSLWLQGKKDDSIKELIRAIELDGNKLLAEKLAAKAKTGPPEDVIRLLLFEWRDDPPGTNPPSNAYLATSIGDREKAMYWVERSVAERHAWTTWFYAAPEFESLRDIPRFQEILREMKFIE